MAVILWIMEVICTRVGSRDGYTKSYKKSFDISLTLCKVLMADFLQRNTGKSRLSRSGIYSKVDAHYAGWQVATGGGMGSWIRAGAVSGRIGSVHLLARKGLDWFTGK